jgi:DNA invertase Pin-like site-specific DNA recombinase
MRLLRLRLVSSKVHEDLETWMVRQTLAVSPLPVDVTPLQSEVLAGTHATSIEGQVRQCQRTADLKGWAVLRDLIRSDSEASGATLHQREGLTSVIAEAKKVPRPFDCIVIDDTSRLGRNLTDVLRVSDILKHHSVFLYFVSQQLDSRDRSFRQRQYPPVLLIDAEASSLQSHRESPE